MRFFLVLLVIHQIVQKTWLEKTINGKRRVSEILDFFCLHGTSRERYI